MESRAAPKRTFQPMSLKYESDRKLRMLLQSSRHHSAKAFGHSGIPIHLDLHITAATSFTETSHGRLEHSALQAFPIKCLFYSLFYLFFVTCDRFLNTICVFSHRI